MGDEDLLIWAGVGPVIWAGVGRVIWAGAGERFGAQPTRLPGKLFWGPAHTTAWKVVRGASTQDALVSCSGGWHSRRPGKLFGGPAHTTAWKVVLGASSHDPLEVLWGPAR
jgi:hypothetical protein